MPSLLRFEDSSPTVDRTGRPQGGLARRSPKASLEAFRSRLSGEYDSSLSTLIESEIIPRLMIAHAADTPLSDAGDATDIAPGDSENLASLALQIEADGLLAHVEGLLARGIPLQTVMVDLMAPAARRLGEYWEEDRCDFVDVTMGLWRLQEVVHEIAFRLPPLRATPRKGRRALFATMPGDQHTFGTVVIEEIFRCDGWLTDRISGASSAEIMGRLAEDWFDIIGLTVSCDCHIGALPSMIAGMRSVSRNPRVSVMVGGWIFAANPGLAATVGADATARDANLALKLAGTLVDAHGGEATHSR